MESLETLQFICRQLDGVTQYKGFCGKLGYADRWTEIKVWFIWNDKVFKSYWNIGITAIYLKKHLQNIYDPFVVLIWHISYLENCSLII